MLHPGALRAAATTGSSSRPPLSAWRQQHGGGPQQQLQQHRRRQQRRRRETVAVAAQQQQQEASAAGGAATPAAGDIAAAAPLPSGHGPHVTFVIPPAHLDTPLDAVLRCPTMRDQLGPARPNPLPDQMGDVWDGKYVSDDDRVALNVMDFGSAASSGAHMTALPAAAAAAQQQLQQQQPQSQQDGGGGGGRAASPATTNLPLSSGVFGSLWQADGSGDGGGAGAAADAAAAAALGLPPLLPGHAPGEFCMQLPPFAMRAGPRPEVYFDAGAVTAAIITTGGLCPGMNDVIESMVKRLNDYGVPEDSVLGIRYGMRGFGAGKDFKPVVLARRNIDGIHLVGGTILGTSYEHRSLRARRHHHHHHHQPTHGPSSASSSSSSSGSESGDDDDDDDGGGDSARPSSSSSGGSGGASSGPESASRNDGGGRAGAGVVAPGDVAAEAAAAYTSTEARIDEVLDKIEFWRINILLVVGGAGGNSLGAQLAEGCRRRNIRCVVVGVPKSIDNDLPLVDRTFGFDTVVHEVVQRPLLAAKVEAASARKGVGIVKVFGRRSGFIASQASLASGVVDVCLIPEESFDLDGPHGVLEYVKRLLEDKGHAVICVAEGAGQDLLYAGETIPLDEAGNPVLRDVGAALKKAIKGAVPDADVKYIDPSYLVQAVIAGPQDHIFCRVLGFHAVDAAFAGYTGVMVGQVNGHYVLLPSAIVTQSSRRVDTRGKSWNRLRASIGQPRFKPPRAPGDGASGGGAAPAAAATAAASTAAVAVGSS